jgi:CRP/FNR family transcriptional regulator, cyclic AMP receptor protein
MLQDGQVQMIPIRLLEPWVRKWPEAYCAIATMFANEYYALLDYHVNSVIGNVPGRIARLLQQWASSSSADQRGHAFEIPFTHQEIASLLSTTRETVGRTLDRFEREHIIERDKQMIRIVSDSKLARSWPCSTKRRAGPVARPAPRPAGRAGLRPAAQG